MALTRSLIVYNGSDSTPATDFTDRTDWQQTELASMANLGEAAASQWLMRDEGGTLPDFKSPEELADAHNVAIARVGSNILFRGRIAADEHFRGRQKAGRAKEITLTLEDQNSHLRGIVVHDWVRPAETDVARALALVSAYLNGSPRATTVLGTSLIITGSNTISLAAKTYSGVTPFEIMQELAANGDKETFVSIDNELALFGHDYTGYASLLRVSDDPADANSTTYAPWEPRGSQFGRQRLSALRTYYGTDVVQSTTRVTNSNASQFDYWEDVFWDSESTTDTQAAARAQKMLDYRATADVSYSCAIGPMSGDEIWKIKPGQTIQYKSRASRGGRNPNGTYTGDSFLTTRIRELRWTTPAEDQYTAHLELERPKRLSPPSTGNQALATVPRAAPARSCIYYDHFSRSESSGWGTATSGQTWETSFAGQSVNGAQGVLTHRDLSDGYWTGTNILLRVAGTPSTSPLTGLIVADEIEGTFDFTTPSVLPAYGAIDLRLSRDGAAVGTNFVSLAYGNNESPHLSASRAYTSGTPQTLTMFGGFAFTGATTYSVRAAVSALSTYLRIWPRDTPEPTTWNVTASPGDFALTPVTGQPPYFDFLLVTETQADTAASTVLIDNVCIAGDLATDSAYALAVTGDSPYYVRSDDPRFDSILTAPIASGDLIVGSNTGTVRLAIGSSNTHLISDGITPSWVPNTGGGGVTAHSALTGLTTGDDHTQYLLETLIDAGGDLLVGTAADTAGRLAIGASNTHLVSDGASASWRVDTDWISKTLIDAAGDLILGLTSDNPGRLGIGGSNTHLVSDGVTASWQSQPVASGGSAAKASGSGDVTTTGSLQDLTGSTLSLGAGTYIVAGSFDVLVNNAANDKTFEGHLDVGGADENDVAISVALARVNDRFTVTQHWLVTFGATTTVKLRAQHSGGTLGDFTVKGANTTITAWVSGGGGGSSLTDHTHAITGSGATGGGGSLAPTALILPTSLGTTAGQVDWDATNYVAEVYDSQRERAVSASGWGNILYPAGYSPSAALTTSLTLAANGGSVALWVPNPGHALVGDIAVRSLDTGTARSWRWDIYVEDLNNGNAGENTVRRIAQSNGSESFTPGAASTRFLDPNAGEPYLPPGWLILVIQNTHATSTFALGSTAASTFGTAINSARTKTTTNPNGATLDLIAATWTNNTSIIAAIIRGAPLGQTAAL